MRHRLLAFAVLLSFLVSFASIATAQVNGFAVCSDPSTQTTPEMVPDGAGGVIITWLDGRNGSTQGRIYAQRLNAAGTPQWTANGVAVSVINGNDAEPCIVADAAGGAIIAWQHNVPNGIIYAQRLDASGALQWPTSGPKNGIQITTSGSGSDPVIATDRAGGAIIVWRDNREIFGFYDIYASKVTALGTLPWGTNGTPVCMANIDQIWPVAVTDQAGGAIIAWLDERTGFDVYMERLNTSGVRQWGSGSGVFLGASTNWADSPAIVADGTGGAIIAWDTDASNYDLIAQHVDDTGAPQWAGGTLVCTASNLQIHPHMVSDGAAGAMITWQDSRTNPDWDAYVQHVNAAGITQWNANGVRLTNQYAELPVVATDGSGGALVAWVDTRNVSDRHNIFVHSVSAVGTAGFPSDGTPECTAPGDQIGLRMVYSGSRAFATWQDRRSGGWDIYALVMSVATGVGDTPALSALALGPNHPNPFLEGTTMNLDLPSPSDVKIDVFDVAGHRVRQSHLGRLSAGAREITFDGHDDAGRPLPSGVYFYCLHAGSESVVKKMVIAR